MKVRPQVSLLVRGKLSKGRHEVICVCFYSKTPQRLRNGAQQKSVTAQPNLTELSFSNTDKGTSVSIVSNTHHMTVSSTNMLLHLIALIKWFSKQTSSNTVGLYIHIYIYNSAKPLLMPPQSAHHQGPNWLERRFRDDRGILLESQRMLLLCKLFVYMKTW